MSVERIYGIYLLKMNLNAFDVSLYTVELQLRCAGSDGKIYMEPQTGMAYKRRIPTEFPMFLAPLTSTIVLLFVRNKYGMRIEILETELQLYNVESS